MSQRSAKLNVSVSAETNYLIRLEAQKIEWSVSKLVDRILTDWLESTKDSGGSFQLLSVAEREFIVSLRSFYGEE